MSYRPRLIDQLLDEMMAVLPAIAIEGARGVGKTATATRRAKTIRSLDNSAIASIVRADPGAVLHAPRPLLIDEWQLEPTLWDAVRRAVDADATPGQFILTGSTAPEKQLRIHSGAGRIVGLHLRPMALCERQLGGPTVSLGAILADPATPIDGQIAFALPDYVDELVASGLPGIRSLAPPGRPRALTSYLARTLDRDMFEAGQRVRHPAALERWLRAYAGATATSASYNIILDAATADEPNKPARSTVAGYRETLERMRLLDPLPAWSPTFTSIKRVAGSPKHYLVDPALAVALVGATPASLLRGDGPTPQHEGSTFLGHLFEALAVLTVRAIADSLDLTVGHFRTQNGDHEVDIVVETRDGRALAIEVKLATTIADRDVRHLNWLHHQLGERLVGRLVLHAGPIAYRRRDGVAVIPLAMLGR